MRKTTISLGGALVLCLATALPALADSSLPQPHSGPQVLGGSGGGGAGGTAFTGADLSFVLLALAVLVVAGISLFAFRAVRTAHD